MARESQRGQSLMEILIGLGIISIMVGASTYALVSVLRSSSITEQNQSAGLIGNSLLESASTLAEANWNSIYNLNKTLSNHYFLAKSSTTTPTPVPGDEGILEQDVINGLVGHWKLDEHSGTVAYDYSGSGNNGTLTNIPDINSGLVGYWKFDEESGTTVTDFSGYNNNGSFVNSPTRNESRNCKIGRCLSFSGNGGYVSVPSSSSLNFDIGDFTISFWASSGSYKPSAGIISKGLYWTTPGAGYTITNISNPLYVYLNTYDGTTQRYITSSLSTYPWTYITFIKRAGNIEYYKNGVLQTTNTAPPNALSNSLPLTIGYGPSGSWIGSIDDLRMYNRALSASEVSRLYGINNCKVGSCMAFNGTSQYISLGSDSSMNQNIFTLSAWIKPASVTAGTIFGGFRTNGDTKNFVRLSNGKIGIDQYPPGGGSINSNATLLVNNWYHVAIIQNGSYWAVYVNGVLDNSNTIAETYAGGTPTHWNIGKREYVGSEGYYSGLLDDIRLYNRALSASEISQLYNSPVYLRYFYVDNVKRTVCGTGDITAAAESTCIGSSGVGEDPGTQKITVGTAWDLKGVREVLQNSTYVTRWVNSAVYQNNWSGTSGITSAVNDFSTNYFSSTGIEVTASGTIKVSGVTSDNPAPTTTGISPTSKTAGDAEFTLTVNGTNFISSSIVRFNGANKTTTYVNSGQLTAIIPASDITSAGSYSVTVYTPTPGGGTSNAQTFTVDSSIPFCGSGDTSGMVSYWKMNDSAANTIVLDNMGINNGTAPVNTSTITATGKVGSALYASGNTYVADVTNAARSIFGGTNPWTIMMWVKGTLSETQHVPIFGFGNNLASGPFMFYAYHNYGGGGTIQFHTAVGDTTFGYTNFLMTNNTWYHLAFVRNGNVYSMYVNGSVAPSTVTSADNNVVSSALAHLGELSGTNGTVRYLDEVAFYNRALTSNEILSHYNLSNSGSVYCQNAPSSAKAITAFNFTSPVATGTINEVAHTVSVTVPMGTNVTALVPTITISALASVNPASGVAQNFTNPVTYRVTAENGTTQDYVVTVTIDSAPICGSGDFAGMQGYWKLDSNATDYLGLYNGSGSPTYTTGKLSTALNGPQQCSGPGIVQVSSFPNLAGSMTVGGWINPSCSSWQGAFSISKYTEINYGGPGWYIMANPNPYGGSNYNFSFRTGTQAAGIYTTSTLYACGWHFVVATRTFGGDIRIYVDGVLSGTPTADNSTDPSTSGALAFHGFASGGCGWGMSAEVVDEVFIFNRALSAAEILAMYNRSSGGQTYCQ